MWIEGFEQSMRLGAEVEWLVRLRYQADCQLQAEQFRICDDAVRTMTAIPVH